MKVNKGNKEALEAYGREKGIPEDMTAQAMCRALEAAGRKMTGEGSEFVAEMNWDTYDFIMFQKKTVVEEVENDIFEISKENARHYKADAVVGDVIRIPFDYSKAYGRVQAHSVRSTLRGNLKELSKERLLEIVTKNNTESLVAKVIYVDNRTKNAKIEIESLEVDLPRNEQIPGEVLEVGKYIEVYILKVNTDKNNENKNNYKVVVSRTNPGLIKRLFEKQVSEIFDGKVEIKSIAREAGSRTKIAVASKDSSIDPVGACIGENGNRIKTIIDQINGEKIDVIKYSEKPEDYIKAALSPADIVSVQIIDEENRKCVVQVPEKQLSLAIGNKGQNARLAARLTGWKIDIKPFYGDQVPYATF